MPSRSSNTSGELPDVDADRVGWLGVSHGGEMLLKVASEYDGLRAGVAAEPAAGDYLARLPPDPNAPPEPPQPETMEINTSEMQAAAVEAARGRIDMERAMARIRAIDMPIFVAGRDRDHNQSTFRLAYELMTEAGKPFSGDPMITTITDSFSFSAMPRASTIPIRCSRQSWPTPSPSSTST